MAKCDANALASQASCFYCLPPGYYYPAKLALLARLLKLLDPTADTSRDALMRDGACIACLPPGEVGPLKLALLNRIASHTLPNFAIPYDNMSDYNNAVGVNGLNGGFNGTSPTITWQSAYVAPGPLPGLYVYDNMSDYANGVNVSGLDGGVELIGTWDSPYAGR